jgi:rubrerythrin
MKKYKNMAKYICRHCNFKFESQSPSDCPYCGRGKTLEKEKSAGELLQEINDILN